jgi:hypothetical protein
MEKQEWKAALKMMAMGALAGRFRNFAATHRAGFLGHAELVN